MAIELHIFDSHRRFGSLRQETVEAFQEGLVVVGAKLPVDEVDVVVKIGKWVVPETGIAGYCPTAHEIYITVDPDNPNLCSGLKGKFIATLAHELHHSMRWRGPGYGTTLGEALVTEGLACHFEFEINGKMPAYSAALDAHMLKAAWARARPILNANPYDHKGWFFGSVEQKIERCTGYSLGSYIVGLRLKQTSEVSSKLWAVPAAKFYEKT